MRQVVHNSQCIRTLSLQILLMDRFESCLGQITPSVNALNECYVKTWPCGTRSVCFRLGHVCWGLGWTLSSSGGLKHPQRWGDHSVSCSVLYGRAHRPLRNWRSHFRMGLSATALKSREKL